MMSDRLKIDRDLLAAFCRRHRIPNLSLFGSMLREDFGPTSDIDVLVKFDPQADRSLTYFALAGMQFELERMFGRPVDLSKYFRDEVIRDAEALHAA